MATRSFLFLLLSNFFFSQVAGPIEVIKGSEEDLAILQHLDKSFLVVYGVQAALLNKSQDEQAIQKAKRIFFLCKEKAGRIIGTLACGELSNNYESVIKKQQELANLGFPFYFTNQNPFSLKCAGCYYHQGIYYYSKEEKLLHGLAHNVNSTRRRKWVKNICIIGGEDDWKNFEKLLDRKKFFGEKNFFNDRDYASLKLVRKNIKKAVYVAVALGQEELKRKRIKQEKDKEDELIKEAMSAYKNEVELHFMEEEYVKYSLEGVVDQGNFCYNE